ncbi:MAG: hypothetical protein JW709_05060 [Sedimentisphaerales bacterium]|nr:hypothetical protein [Sedimentisphaerales bacterium]
MLKKLLVLVVCVSLCLLGVMGCKKTTEEKAEDAVKSGAKDVEKTADKAMDAAGDAAKDAGKAMEDATK